jgi:hypothetical protein
MKKYYKPKSLAWWASFAPLIGGVILALSEALPQLRPAASVIQSLAGADMTAARLVQLGLLGIGLRGAL